MPDFCTCGAQLPPDALFCHKCGKPQRDIVVPESQAPPPLIDSNPAPMAQREAIAPGFHNPVAVRIGLVVALTATVLSMTVLPFVSWPAAGFFAVLLYRRRTGSSVDVGNGARLGMMTGILMAAMFTVMASLLWLPAAFSGKLSTVMQEQMKSVPWRDPAALQMLNSLSGSDMALWLLFIMIFVALLITGLSAAGGALGAKLVGRA